MPRFIYRTAVVLILLAAFVQASSYKSGGNTLPLAQRIASAITAPTASSPQPQLAQPVPATAQKGSKNDENRTVYITRTGKKYHGPNCSYLRQSKIPISLKEARKRGYTACSRCGGR